MKGFTDSHVTGYYDYMVNMAVLLGAERARARHEMREALGLELNLAEFSLPRETRNNYTALHNPVTLAQLQTLFPGDSSSINMSNIMRMMRMMTMMTMSSINPIGGKSTKKEKGSTTLTIWIFSCMATLQTTSNSYLYRCKQKSLFIVF